MKILLLIIGALLSMNVSASKITIQPFSLYFDSMTFTTNSLVALDYFRVDGNTTINSIQYNVSSETNDYTYNGTSLALVEIIPDEAFIFYNQVIDAEVTTIGDGLFQHTLNNLDINISSFGFTREFAIHFDINPSLFFQDGDMSIRVDGTREVSTVPLPASAWLFITGLLVLSRKKHKHPQIKI